MLREASVTPFLGATDLKRARAFFEGVLGLEVVSVDGFALVLRTGSGTIRVTQVETAANAPYTVLGWDVPDVASAVRELAARGVAFNRYPGMEQDELGVWIAPSGSRIAWFLDPDGNVLSLAQHPS
ncbi:MAG TPA: VOC family protein [Polyangiaceae bacterium]|jgi:catechol 2,3-dioxygenase-like lactoylglutathione lyase family enzyme|nr:VOC family protein [Polyangiaceae bacterium]